jgi:hypothetical protein
MAAPSVEQSLAKQPPKLMIASPVYGGLSHLYVLSLIETRAKLRDMGITTSVFFLPGIALVSHARNELGGAFMASGCERLLMIDADIGWKVDTVLRMLDRKSDFVGGAPPHRRLNLPLVTKAALDGRPNPERFARDYAVRLTDEDRSRGSKTRSDNGFIEVGAVGTAFLMLTRRVFESIALANPDLKYRSKEKFDSYAFFNPYVYKGENLPEDGAFCRRWTDTGGKIELLLEATFTHEGPVAITGSLHEILDD